MNKTKSIVWLCVIVVVLALYTVVSFLPRFEVSATNDFVPIIEQIQLGTDFAPSVSPDYRIGEYTVFSVDEFYRDYSGNYVDAQGNVVDEADKVAVPADVLAERTEAIAQTMKERLVLLTNSTYEVSVLDGNKIRVQMQDIANSLTIFDILKQTGYVQLKLLPDSPTDTTVYTDYEDVLSYNQIEFYGLNWDTSTSSYYALFNFVEDGAQVFREASRAYRDDSDNTMYLCLLIDGVLQGTPMQITATYTATYIYFTGFTSQVDAIEAGVMSRGAPYEAPITKSNIDIKAVSSRLGDNAATNVFLAGIVLLAVAIIAFIVLYGGMGVAASMGILLFVLLLVSTFVLVPATPFNMTNAFGVIAAIIFAFAAQAMLLESVKKDFATSTKARKLAIKDGLKNSIFGLLALHVALAAVAIPCAVFMSGAVSAFAMSLVFGVILSVVALLFTVLMINILNPLFKSDKVFGLKRASTKEGK